MRRFIPIAAILVLAAATAQADVTITSTVTGKGGPVSFNGQSTTFIKGSKMRVDSMVGNQQTSLIVDAATGQIVFLNHKNREAENYSSAKLFTEIQKEQAGEAKVSLTPNGQTREIAGLKCEGYDYSFTMPMAMGNDSMNITMAGPVWIARNAPGAADYRAFYEAAIKNGVFLGGNPRQVKGQASNVKAMTELYRQIAVAGIPYAHELQMKYDATGPMADMMNRMGGMTSSTTVTAVSADPIGDDKFAVPAGYTTKAK